jgi:hypothetical protein
LNGSEKDLRLTTFFEGGLSNGLLKVAAMYKQPQWRFNEKW